MGEVVKEPRTFSCGDVEDMTLKLPTECPVLPVGKVFRTNGEVPGQEDVYWEIKAHIEGFTYTVECVGINMYIRAVM